MRGRETFEHGFVQNKFKTIEIEESNEMFVSSLCGEEREEEEEEE